MCLEMNKLQGNGKLQSRELWSCSVEKTSKDHSLKGEMCFRGGEGMGGGMVGTADTHN